MIVSIETLQIYIPAIFGSLRRRDKDVDGDGAQKHDSALPSQRRGVPTLMLSQSDLVSTSHDHKHPYPEPYRRAKGADRGSVGTHRKVRGLPIEKGRQQSVTALRPGIVTYE